MKPHPDLVKKHANPLGQGNGTSDNLPSSAHFAEPTELAGSSFAYRSGQILLGQRRDENGQLVPVGFGGSHRPQDDRHLVTIAGARGGKGLTLVRPNLMTYRGSMLIIDPKGEHAAFELAERHRAKLGHKTPMLDPFRIVGGKGSFNPFAGLEKLDQFGLLDRLSLIGEALIIPEGKDPHWTNGAKNLLRFLMLWMLATPETGKPSLARLRALVMGAESPFRSVADADGNPLYPSIFEQALTKGEETKNDELALMAAMFTQTNEKEIGYFASTLQNQLSFLAEIAPSSSDHDFDLSELKSGKLSVFLILPASKIPSHFRWLRLLLVLAVAEMEKGEAPALDVVFLLEEFAALGHLEVIEKAAGLMPGFGIKLWCILQDLTQLQKLYGKSWETFLDNAGAITAWANDEPTTTEYLSKRLGQKLYKVRENNALGSQGLAGASPLSTERREWMPLLPSSQIGQAFRRDAEGLPMLLLRKGHSPAIINRLPYDWRP